MPSPGAWHGSYHLEVHGWREAPGVCPRKTRAGLGIRNPPARNENVCTFLSLRLHRLIGFDLAVHARITLIYSSLLSSSGHGMVSSVNYDYDDRGASSELRGPVRSTRLPCKFSAAVLHRAPLRTASGRAPHTFGSLPDLRAPHVFGLRAFRMVGKSHLPAAERKASVNKSKP